MSLHRRIGSRLRFSEYLRNYRERLKGKNQDRGQGWPLAGESANQPPGRESDAPAAAGKHRSLPVLYRELYRVLKGHRRTIALARLGLSLSTLLKLIPPAATKAAIDYVLLARPLPTAFQEWSPFPIPESPRLRLVMLVAVVTAITIVGTMVGLWSRWLGTRTTKRVQVDVRRKVYEHAMRLPLHRVYQLKSGGASSLLREDAGGVGELVFSMLYNPWRAVGTVRRGPGGAGASRLAAPAGLALPRARRLLLRPALEPPDPAALPRRAQEAAGDRQRDHRGLRGHASGPGLRPPEERIGAVYGREPPHEPARASRLVALAAHRAALGVRAAHGLRRASPLWRDAGPPGPALARRPDDVPGLPDHAPGTDGRAGHQRDPVPEQPLGFRPGARRAGGAPRDGRLSRSSARPQGHGRGTHHARAGWFRLSRNQPPGASRHRPGRRAGRDACPGWPQRIGQDHPLQPRGPIL